MKNVKTTMVFGLLLLSLVWGIVVPSNKSAQSKTYQPNEFDTVQITVHEGWNLISLPLIVPDGRVKVLFPSAISSAFKYEGSYKPCDTLEVGKGYWLKFEESELINIVGQKCSEESTQVNKGWNMIGSTFRRFLVNIIQTNPSDIVISKYYGYKDNGYYETDTIKSGCGYWVKVDREGRLWLNEWEKISDLIVNSLTINYSEPNILYAGVHSNFPEQYDGRIYKSYDWGFTWDTLVYNIDVNGISIDPINPNILYAGLGGIGLTRPGIIKTTDGGINWFYSDHGMIITSFSSVGAPLIDPNNSNILYTEYRDFAFMNSTQFKSLNGGESWHPLIEGDSIECPKDPICSFSDGATMAINHLNSEILYAGTLGFLYPFYFFKTVNGGQTWDVMNSFPREYGPVFSIVVDTDTNVIYVGGKILLRTTDAGETWHSFQNDLPDSVIFGRVMLTNDPNLFFINVYSLYGDDKDKAFKSTNGGLNWKYIDIDRILSIDKSNGFLYGTRLEDGIYRLKLK